MSNTAATTACHILAIPAASYRIHNEHIVHCCTPSAIGRLCNCNSILPRLQEYSLQSLLLELNLAALDVSKLGTPTAVSPLVSIDRRIAQRVLTLTFKASISLGEMLSDCIFLRARRSSDAFNLGKLVCALAPSTSWTRTLGSDAMTALIQI